MNRIHWRKYVFVALMVAGLAASFAVAWDTFQGNFLYNFYGRMIDAEGNGLSGVVVTYHIGRTKFFSLPALMFSGGQTGDSQGRTVSDKDGYFSIIGAHGTSLTLSDFHKNGIKLYDMDALYTFLTCSRNRPTPSKPTVYTLTPLIVGPSHSPQTRSAEISSPVIP